MIDNQILGGTFVLLVAVFYILYIFDFEKITTSDTTDILKEESITTGVGRKSICSHIITVICICILGYCGICFCYNIYRKQRERQQNPEEGKALTGDENPTNGCAFDGDPNIKRDESNDAEQKNTYENCGSVNRIVQICNTFDDNTVNNVTCGATTYKQEGSKDVEVAENVQGGKSSRNRTGRHDKTKSGKSATTGSASLDESSNQDSHSGTCIPHDKFKSTTDTTNFNNPKSEQGTTIADTSHKKPHITEVSGLPGSVTRCGATGATASIGTPTGDLHSGEETSDTTLGKTQVNNPTDRQEGLWLPKLVPSIPVPSIPVPSIPVPSSPLHPYKSYEFHQPGANVIGFRNLGNTCFFNSMLQCVQQTLPLHDVLKEIMTEKDYIIPSTISDTVRVPVTHSSPHPLTTALQHLFYEVNSYRYKESFSPYDVLTALGRENSRFSRRSQEDSHEALRCLLNAIRQNEISAIRKSIYRYYEVNENPLSHRILDGEDKLSMKDHLSKASKGVCAIDGLIGTVLVSTTICHDCFTPLQIEELCLDLSLPMSFQSVQQHWLPATPPSKQINKRKEKREKKKKVITPLAGQNQNINNITSSLKSSYNKEKTTQPSSHTHKVGPGVQKEMEATEIYSECDDADISSDEDDDHLHDEDSPYNSNSSESDDENSISNATPTFLKTFRCYSDDDYLTTDSDSTASCDDSIGSSYSSNEDDEEFLNGYFDSTISHLFINNDPSSAEEESDDEFVYEVDLLPLIQPTCSHKASPVATDENGNVISAVDTQDVSLTGPNVDLATSTDVTDDTSEDTEDMDSYEQPDSKVLYYKQALNEFLKRKGFTSSASIDYRSYPGTMLEQSLSDFTKLDVLDENNKFICQQCSSAKGDTVECRVSKQNLIHHLPPVLILQMKRFNIGFYNVTKDGRHVSFPLVLDMGPYCTSDCIQKMADKNQEILYGLYGVVVHHGSTLHGGHYTAYVRQRPQHHTPPPVSTSRYNRETASTGKWYDISDSWVSSGCTFSDVQKCQAYLLFYELLPLL
ncbi:ubiquitin carboxyl-terminal hydrolase 16-like isoform X3 [Dysidea avara]|uniref:ubiquitin carboxyl-terminal hydrolase 16-like isoform X3 n=1 Tax=Dysidea avara TaxID=196820 RepID=UPI00332D9B75